MKISISHAVVILASEPDDMLSMISRLQPHASSMEAGSIRKPYQNLISISGKQNFNSEYHYLVFDGF